jgi:hypothetical protein
LKATAEPSRHRFGAPHNGHWAGLKNRGELMWLGVIN